MNTQRCPRCRNYRLSLITYQGDTRGPSCLVGRIRDLEAELAEAKALNAEMRRLLENVGFNYNNVSGVGYPTVPPAWFDERDALLNPNSK